MTESIRLLARAAAFAYSNTLVGDPAPIIATRRQRMVRPQIGDLVVELTTCRREPFDPSCVGWLDDVRDEPSTNLDEWLADGNELPAPTDQYWYVRPLIGGDVARWWNCAFISIPDGNEDEWLGRSGPSFAGGL